jgi:sn-glycerol 3-phosphate transport system permease protein
MKKIISVKVKAVFFRKLMLLFRVGIGLIIVSPLFLGFGMSFMNPSEMSAVPLHLIPRTPVVYTYAKVLETIPVFRFLLNSFIACTLVIAGQIITSSFGAYAFSFYRFRGQKFLFMVVLATIMIPVDAIIIANYLTISRFRLNDTYAALVMPYLASAMGIFLMRQFFLTIPKELHEAAILDGCRDLRFLLSVVMPISKPAAASLGVYIFINVYNQFFWPLLVTNSDRMRTIQVGMSLLRDAERSDDYGVIMAGAMMTLIPAVFAFIVGQKHLVKGMTAGAIKG